MKILLLISVWLCAFDVQPPTDDLTAVSKAVHAFSQSADTKDLKKMETVLHDDFRAIVNQAFESEKVEFMDKSLYLQLLKDGKIGGSKRKVELLSIDMTVNTAIVKAKLSGEQLIFTTFIQVVKNAKGEWKVLSDMPQIEVVK